MKRKLISLCEAKESSQHREGRGRQRSVLDWRDLQIASVLLSTNNRLIIESSECRTLFYSIYFFLLSDISADRLPSAFPYRPQIIPADIMARPSGGGEGGGGQTRSPRFSLRLGKWLLFFLFFPFIFFTFSWCLLCYVVGCSPPPRLVFVGVTFRLLIHVCYFVQFLYDYFVCLIGFFLFLF